MITRKVKVPRQLQENVAELQKRKVEVIFSNKKTNCSLAYVDRLVRKKRMCTTIANVLASLFIKNVNQIERRWIMQFSVLIHNTVHNYYRTIPLAEIVEISNILHRKQNEVLLHQTHLPIMRRRLEGIIKIAEKRQGTQTTPVELKQNEGGESSEPTQL